MNHDRKTGLVGIAAPSSRALRWTVGITISLMSCLGLMLLYLLLQATNNDFNDQSYAQLLVVNIAAAAALFCAIAWVTFRLYVRWRQGRFGSRLLIKLAAVFALVGLGPGLLIYVVSYQFASRSIESWFDVKVEGALEAGLNLGRVTLETLTSDLTTKARSAAAQISETPDALVGLQLDRMLEQIGALDVTIWNSNAKLLASVGPTSLQLVPARPSSSQLRAARSERGIAWVEGLDEASFNHLGDVRIKVLVPITGSELGLVPELRYLLVTRALPSNLIANALAVEAANREYQERALGRQGLRRMYLGTLTLSLVLAVFGAVLLAVILGDQIARPLLVLAEGVDQVAAGDFTPKLSIAGRDELGGLTRAFASMTRQLADARQAVQDSMEQVDAARSNLQTILDNLTAGVLVLGPEGDIRSANPGATRILKAPMAAYQGRHLDEFDELRDFAQTIHNQFADFLIGSSEHQLDHWQRTVELGTGSMGQTPNAQGLTLVVRGAMLPGEDRLVVFDDISDIVSAQRAQAWGEVARRLAHEIKNPLTPIQLSAERLERKLAGKLDQAEQALVTKSVKTIVDQVDAMKRLVNDFRDYARLPSADLKPLDINALVIDVLHLYDPESLKTPVRLDLDPACPKVRGDAQQLRQVIHNLLQNAMDAVEAHVRNSGAHSEVSLRTAYKKATTRVTLSVIDTGGGFPDAILKRAFEPYVTTKNKGTGLGLAVVKKIADDHGARIDIRNREQDGVVVGAQVSLSLATDNSA